MVAALRTIDRKAPFVRDVQELLVWRAARSRVARAPYGALLVLGGGPGSGKTTALVDVVMRARSARYARAQDVAIAARNGHTETARAWDDLIAPDLLAIDELGDEARPEVVAQLMRERFDRGLCTIVAGNVSKDDFAKRYADAALESRMESMRVDGFGPRRFRGTLADLRARQRTLGA